MDQKKYALIVAGGKGTRMNSEVPKQFMNLNGKPVLLHTLAAFHRHAPSMPIVLVLPGDEIDTWNKLAHHHDFALPIILQPGGETRFQSVKLGLAKLSGSGLVAIHDGVRPLVSERLISESFRLAAAHGAAVAAVPVKESLRMNDQGTTRAVDRSLFMIVQTPQTFDLDLIRKAYQLEELPALTDDASVAERAGHAISLFVGSYENIKITTKEDLIVAEALLSAWS